MTLHHGDCLDILPTIPDGSVDAIIADPPYGTTACKWDAVIPFEPMWRELRRVIKPGGAIVLFGSEPFSSALRMSNIKAYKYDWIWEKEQATNFMSLEKQPGRNYENASVFCARYYYPQMVKTDKVIRSNGGNRIEFNQSKAIPKLADRKEKYPCLIQKFNRDKTGLHPTQKPVALLEYLIRTYTNEGETVLDFTAGSGTTGVAAVNTRREFIGIELDEGYYNIARERIANTQRPLL